MEEGRPPAERVSSSVSAVGGNRVGEKLGGRVKEVASEQGKDVLKGGAVRVVLDLVADLRKEKREFAVDDRGLERHPIRFCQVSLFANNAERTHGPTTSSTASLTRSPTTLQPR